MSLSQENLKKLKLYPDQIVQDKEQLLEYGNDWLKQWSGFASLLLFPKSTKDVIHIVEWARDFKYQLIPSGGRTGLSGGATALKKEVVVSFDKMNKLIDFNPWDQFATVQAGFITQDLQNFAKDKGLCFPVSFASQGSSQIGGNIATNAGGVHVLKYGNIKNYVLGLEVVTGKGELLKLGRGLVKNAVGYSLKDLFIGSEGTLGFITQATMSLIPPPDKIQVFLLAVEKPQYLLDTYKEFKSKVSPLAFEFFTDNCLKYVLNHASLNFPLQDRSPFYLLIEIEERNAETALKLFEDFYEKSIIKNGVLSQNSSQAKEIWSLRENISEAISSYRPYKNDVSVRVSKMTDFYSLLSELLKKHYPDFEVLIFGHLGDGNLHINILKPQNWAYEDFTKECEKVNKILFDLVKEHEGSISAEHGVGLLKKDYLSYSCSKEEIYIMKKLKKIFDPDGVLNPGKIFDSN